MKDRLIELSNERRNNVKKYFFSLKLQRQDNTCEGNGYGIWVIKWHWFKKQGSLRLLTQKLGNGDDGSRCEA